MAITYNVYSNDGAGGPIDYTTAIDTASGTTWTSGDLASGAWSFAVRAENANGEEQNLDCAVTITLDGSGADISNRPDPPVGLRAFATSGGGIRLEWHYPTTRGAKTPTGFHVYIGTGGSPDYGTPVATVAYSAGILNTYVANLSGLTGGTTYTIGCRAFNATSEESNTTTASVTANSTGPLAVTGLSATATA